MVTRYGYLVVSDDNIVSINDPSNRPGPPPGGSGGGNGVSVRLDAHEKRLDRIDDKLEKIEDKVDGIRIDVADLKGQVKGSTKTLSIVFGFGALAYTVFKVIELFAK